MSRQIINNYHAYFLGTIKAFEFYFTFLSHTGMFIVEVNETFIYTYNDGQIDKMTSLHGNILRVTSLCEGNRWIPLPKASHA